MMYLLILLLLPTVQASYDYAAACVPNAYYPPETNQCTLLILSKSTVDIEIHTTFDTSTFTLPAGTLYERDFGMEYHLISGSENKAIRINSTYEIQVLMLKNITHNNQFQDMYMVPNQIRNNDTYFTSSYTDSLCSSGYPKQFYMVASFYPDTDINIIQQDGTTYDITLQEYGTFVQTTNSPSDHLASGTKITSSKPINVISGYLCALNRVPSSDGSFNSYVSIVPNVESLGNGYVVPKIISDDINDSPAGYSVGVVATEDGTIVISDGAQHSIDEGEDVMFEYDYKATSIYVSCSKPCLVSQYAKSDGPTYGMFMHNLLSDQQFSTSAFFTTLYTAPMSFLSLVVQGEAPGDDLFLNGTSLGSLTWTTINGYSSAELAIPAGAYEIESVNDRPFAAYVYIHQMYRNTASGYALLPSSNPMSTTAPAITTTTPSPIVNGTLPQHTVRVNGTAYTSDGQDVTPQCAMEHLNNLKEKNSQMLVEVNKAIGKNICMESEDLFDVSVVEGISVQGDKALIRIDHVLRVDWQHVAADVETCALEVGEYLNNLANWQQPIFPDVPGCSRLEIMPPYFNTTGTFWKCDNQLSEELDLSNNLSYESKVSEVLATKDGVILDVGCTDAYTDEAAKKTTSMLGEISEALASSGCNDLVFPATQTASLIALGDQAYFVAAFYYVPRPLASFAEFVACMNQVHAFSLMHENWSPGSQPGAPFLPVPPGCPALEHASDTLDDEGTRWRCV